MAYQIRQLGIHDLPALQTLRLEAPHEHTLGSKEEHDRSSACARLKQDLLDPCRTFGCFDGTRLIGACTITERWDEPSPHGGWLYEGVPSGLLVDQAHRGQGIAGRLVDACLKSTKAYRVKGFLLTIRCPRSNPQTDAWRLYDGFGFSVTSPEGAEEDPPSEFVHFTMMLSRRKFVLMRRERRRQEQTPPDPG